VRDLFYQERATMRALDVVLDLRRLIIIVRINTYEIAVTTRTNFMNQSRHALAAGATLAFNEYWRLALGDLRYLVSKLFHSARVSEELVTQNESHRNAALCDFAMHLVNGRNAFLL
jgi:hypothetical protein